MRLKEVVVEQNFNDNKLRTKQGVTTTKHMNHDIARYQLRYAIYT